MLSISPTPGRASEDGGPHSLPRVFRNKVHLKNRQHKDLLLCLPSFLARSHRHCRTETVDRAKGITGRLPDICWIFPDMFPDHRPIMIIDHRPIMIISGNWSEIYDPDYLCLARWFRVSFSLAVVHPQVQSVQGSCTADVDLQMIGNTSCAASPLSPSLSNVIRVMNCWAGSTIGRD